MDLQSLSHAVGKISNRIHLDLLKQFIDWFERKLYLHFDKQSPNIILSKGSIIYVELGINVGSEIFKTRPCVVISPSIYNMGNTILICPITGLYNDITKLPKNIHSHQYLIIFPDSENMLLKPSLVNLGQMRAISKKRIGLKIGHFSPTHVEKLNKKLKRYLAIKV